MARETNTSGLTRSEFEALDPEDQYYFWVCDSVPSYWYKGDTRPPDKWEEGAPVYQKREPITWKPKTALPVATSYNYTPYDSCERTLERVENAIREANPGLAQTPRLIPTAEVTK